MSSFCHGSCFAQKSFLPFSFLALLFALLFLLLFSTVASAASLWVDPSRGDDSALGSEARPLATLTAAWNRLPVVANEATFINLRAGDYRGRTPVYWENHSGRAGAPIVIRSVDGRGRASLPGVNIFQVNYLKLQDIGFRDGGDVIHCEQCSNFTLERIIAFGSGAQETVKVNQSENIRIIHSRIGGAGDNAIDFVAVRGGVIKNNVVHRAGDWCAYAKGGSVDIVVSGNLFTRCGTGGFSAGQGTGFQFMERPWLHYEAVGMLIQGNTVTDTEGAALAVQGGYNILLRNNVARRVGRRSHVLEALYGGRSCDGRPGDEGRERCGQYLSEGGWGTTAVDDGTNYIRIGNRHVYFIGNVIYNPWPYRSTWQHLEVPAPFGTQPGSNVPDGSAADTDLRFRANIVWNGDSSMPLGIGDGCAPLNPTCNENQLLRENLFNRRKPQIKAVGSLLRKDGWTARYPLPAPPRPNWSDLPAGTPPWTSWPRTGG